MSTAKAIRATMPLRLVEARQSRAALLRSAATIAVVLGFTLPGAAMAAPDACGPADASGQVICTPTGNPFATGIQYIAPMPDLNVALNDGVAVARDAVSTGPSVQIVNNAGTAELTSGNASVQSTGASQVGVAVSGRDGATVTAPSITTQGDNSAGLVVASAKGNITVTGRDVTTLGANSPAVYARGDGGNISLNMTGPVSATGARSTGIYTNASSNISVTSGAITSTANSLVIQAGGSSFATITGDVTSTGSTAIVQQSGAGDADLTMNGNLSANGFGAEVRATGGNANVVVTGDIAATGSIGAYGIRATADNTASVTVNGNISANASVVIGAGIAAYAPTTRVLVNGDIDVSGSVVNGLRINGQDNQITVNGDLRVSGSGSYGGDAIELQTQPGATNLINVSGMITNETNGDGIFILGSGSSTVNVAGGILTSGRGINAEAGMLASNAQITTYSDRADAIRIFGGYGYNPGGAVVNHTGAIKTYGVSAYGVRSISAESANITTSGGITTTGQYADGIHVETTQGFAVTADNISTDGQIAFGVYASDAKAAGDPTDLTNVSSINVGSVEIAGPGSVGIFGRSQNTIAIGAGSITGTGANEYGIRVVPGKVRIFPYSSTYAVPQGLIAQVGDVKMSGDNSTGILGRTSAFINVTSTGTLSVSGANSTAMRVQSYGPVAFAVHDLSVAGAGSTGINAQSQTSVAGKIDGTATSTATQTGPFILLQSAGDTSLLNNGAISTTGDFSPAVVLAGGTSASLSGTGTVNTSGQGSNAVTAQSYGTVTVQQTGVGVAGANSTGVFARGANVAVDLTNLAAAGAASIGVDAQALQDVSVTLRGTGTGAADQVALPSTPLPAGRFTDISTGLINVQAGRNATIANLGSIATTGTNQSGISVRTGNSVVVSGNGNVSTTGNGAAGVYAGSRGTLTQVTQGNIATTGDNANAVTALSYGATSVNVGNISTSGTGSRGVSALGAQYVSVTANSVATSGVMGIGIEAQTYGGAVVKVGSVKTTGTYASGIYAFGRAADVSVTAGSVSVGAANGIVATSTGAKVFVNVGTLTRNGGDPSTSTLSATSATGTYVNFGSVVASTNTSTPAFFATPAVFAQAGAGSVVVNGGSTTVRGDRLAGVAAVSYSAGNATVNLTGTTSTAGINGVGVLAAAEQGNASIRTAAVQTSGTDSVGVTAQGRNASVVTAGPVSVTGARTTTTNFGKAAVNVLATAGAANAQVGSITASGAGLDGLDVSATSTANVVIATAAAITGNVDAVSIISGTGTTLTNGGTLNGGSGAALRVTGGAATIQNTGAINGLLTLSAASDTLTNSGTLLLSGGSTFGAGDDRLINTGTVQLAGDLDFGAGSDTFTNAGTLALSGGTGARTRNLLNLETLANSGLIDLRSGTAGDVLSTSGSFVGSGNSQLAVDVNFNTNTADRLVIGGPATGSTSVIVNPLSRSIPGLLAPISIVQTGAGSSPTAFTLDQGSRSAGFISYAIVPNAAATSFSLVGAPAPTAFRFATTGELVQNLAMWTADSVSDHLTNVRDIAEPHSGLWLDFRGDVSSRQNVNTYTVFGFAQTVDQGYKQDIFGGQAGYDFGVAGIRGGITGGYHSSDINFHGSSDRATVDALNVGLYGAFSAGPLFGNVMAKYDHYRIRASFNAIGADDRFNGHSFSGRVELGLHFGGTAFFAEPIIRGTVIDTKLDRFGAYGASFDFNDRTGIRGEAGLRIGSTTNFGATPVIVYASGFAVRDFRSDDTAIFSAGNNSVAIGTDRLPLHGVGKLGVAIGSGPITGFIQGEGRVGRGYTGGGASTGIRLRF